MSVLLLPLYPAVGRCAVVKACTVGDWIRHRETGCGTWAVARSPWQPAGPRPSAYAPPYGGMSMSKKAEERSVCTCCLARPLVVHDGFTCDAMDARIHAGFAYVVSVPVYIQYVAGIYILRCMQPRDKCVGRPVRARGETVCCCSAAATP
jgi:hypothetical protein